VRCGRVPLTTVPGGHKLHCTKFCQRIRPFIHLFAECPCFRCKGGAAWSFERRRRACITGVWGDCPHRPSRPAPSHRPKSASAAAGGPIPRSGRRGRWPARAAPPPPTDRRRRTQAPRRPRRQQWRRRRCPGTARRQYSVGSPKLGGAGGGVYQSNKHGFLPIPHAGTLNSQILIFCAIDCIRRLSHRHRNLSRSPPPKNSLRHLLFMLHIRTTQHEGPSVHRGALAPGARKVRKKKFHGTLGKKVYCTPAPGAARRDARGTLWPRS